MGIAKLDIEKNVVKDIFNLFTFIVRKIFAFFQLLVVILPFMYGIMPQEI